MREHVFIFFNNENCKHTTYNENCKLTVTNPLNYKSIVIKLQLLAYEIDKKILKFLKLVVE